MRVQEQDTTIHTRKSILNLRMLLHKAVRVHSWAEELKKVVSSSSTVNLYRDIDMSIQSTEIHEKFKQFLEDQYNEKKEEFALVLRLATMLSLSGSFIWFMSSIVFLYTPHLTLGVFLNLIGFLVLVIGLVVLSLIPVEMVDLDDFSSKSVWQSRLIRFTVGFMFFLCGTANITKGDSIWIIRILYWGVVIVVSLSMYDCGMKWWSRFTFRFTALCFLTGLCISFDLYYTYFSGNAEITPSITSATPLLVTGSCFLGLILVSCGCCCHWLRLFYFKGHDNHFSPTIVCYYSIYCFFTAFFCCFGGGEIYQSMLDGESSVLYSPLGSAIVLLVIGTIIPAFLLCFTRARAYKIVSYYLDTRPHKLQQDGAFLSELLSGTNVVLYQRYFLFRPEGEKKTSEPINSTRYHFRRGYVSRIYNSQTFEVTYRNKDRVKETVIVEHGIIQTNDVNLERMRELEAMNGENVDLSTVELLDIAKKSLMCIEGDRLVRSDFEASVRDPGVTEVSKSRHLHDEYERIDFFISHAWCDSPDEKFKHVEAIIANFRKAKDRFPTMWFDKHCFDQDNLTESLKVLAIYLLSCEKILILCGPGYALRLWCVWEIFTLFAVVSEEVALQRIHLITFGDDKIHRDGVLESLCTFKLDQAHCFDPNEEFRLKAVIGAVGVEVFEHRIRLLGSLIKNDLLNNNIV